MSGYLTYSTYLESNGRYGSSGYGWMGTNANSWLQVNLGTMSIHYLSTFINMFILAEFQQSPIYNTISRSLRNLIIRPTIKCFWLMSICMLCTGNLTRVFAVRNQGYSSSYYSSGYSLSVSTDGTTFFPVNNTNGGTHVSWNSSLVRPFI